MKKNKTTAEPLLHPDPAGEYRDVQARIKRAQGFTKGWHQNIERWRSLYDMKHYALHPKKGEVHFNDPTFTNTVDLSVGIMLGNELRWHAYGFSPSRDEQKQTGKLEKLIEGILAVNTERQERMLNYELFMNFTRDGGAVLYSVFDPSLAETKESVQVPDPDSETGTAQRWKFGEMPITLQTVDPLSVLCLPGGPKRWLLAAIREKRSVLDVETEYGVKIERWSHVSDEQRSSSFDEFINVWDFCHREGRPAVRNTVIFAGQPVMGPRIMEGYDDLPLTINFYKPVGSESSQWHNIMVPLQSSVELLERSFNRRARQIDVFSGLPLVVKTQPGRKVTVEPGLFNSVNISPDEEITFPVWPGNAPDVERHLDFLRSRIQQSGFSDVMFGSGSSQVAGYAVSQLGDQNRIRLQQPIKHLELLLTIWAKKALRLLNYYAADSILCVYGKRKGSNYQDEVDLSEIKGFQVRAEIRPMFPNEKQRQVAMSTQVKGVLSDYTIMQEYLNIEQPEDEEQRKLIEATTRHPISLQYAILAELKRRAEEDGDQIAAMTLQMVQKGMVQNASGTEGRAAGPNAPEQLTGLQSPTGEALPQAQGGEPYGQSAADAQEAMAAESPSLMGRA